MDRNHSAFGPVDVAGTGGDLCALLVVLCTLIWRAVKLYRPPARLDALEAPTQSFALKTEPESSFWFQLLKLLFRVS